MPKPDAPLEPGQFDPMLDPDKPASPWRMWAAALGVTAIVMLVLYGLTHHEEGSTQTAASTPAATPAITSPAGPPAAGAGDQNQQNQQSQQAQSQTNGQGGNAPAPANSPKAQDRINNPPPQNNAPANAGAPGK